MEQSTGSSVSWDVYLQFIKMYLLQYMAYYCIVCMPANVDEYSTQYPSHKSASRYPLPVRLQPQSSTPAQVSNREYTREALFVGGMRRYLNTKQATGCCYLCASCFGLCEGDCVCGCLSRPQLWPQLLYGARTVPRRGNNE